MATDPNREKRWPWWGQTRDAVAFGFGMVLASVEIFRGTYNATGMTFAFACFGLAGAGVATRKLIGRWENGK